MRIGLYGVSRSGKNYLINKITSNLELLYIPGSTLLMEISGYTIDEFKKLSYNEKTYWRKQYIKNIIAQNIKKDIIIDGHYCFYHKDTEEFEVAFTEEDKNFYDIILYLDTDASIIKQRLNSSKNELSIEEINNWKSYEIKALKNICKENEIEFTIITDTTNTSYIISFVENLLQWKHQIFAKEITSKLLRKHHNKLLAYKNVLLVDCDKTLSNTDTTLHLWNLLNWDTSKLKENFLDDNYTLYQFYKIQNMYNSLPDGLISKLCKEISDTYEDMNWGLLETILQLNDTFIIAITSGLTPIWINLFKKYNIPAIVIGPTFRHQEVPTIITETVKYQFAKQLKKQGFNVIAIGDSLLDIMMLEEAHHSFLVSTNYLNNSVQKYVSENKTNIQQLDISQQKYKDIRIQTIWRYENEKK